MVSEIGLNLSALENVTLPTLDIPTNPLNFFNNIYETANNQIGGVLTLLILLSFLIIIYNVLTDRTNFSNFQYSNIRGLAISLGIISNMGILFVEIGILTSFKFVAMFIVLFMLVIALSSFSNSKE